jgi:acyl-CoA thioesterase YciA
VNQGHHNIDTSIEPRGELASRMLAMPSYTNPMGNIFGGYLMSVMDAAALMTAMKVANGTVVTVAVSTMTFLEPVRVGDAICCYTDVIIIGTTSLTLAVEVWVLREGQGDRVKVTNAEFKFVALNDNGSPRPVVAQPN